MFMASARPHARRTPIFMACLGASSFAIEAARRLRDPVIALGAER
jgi:hypothetical protein